MFEKPLSGSVDSFRQRYEGTYGFWRDDDSGKRLLVQLRAITARKCLFVDQQDIEYELNTDSKGNVGFEFLPPKSQWYNTPSGVYYVERVAARQFQRGVTDANTRVYGFHKDRAMLAPQTLSFSLLSNIYEKHEDARQAKKTWVAKAPLALSKQIALCQDKVFLFSEQIGTYSKEDEKLVFKIKQPDLWATEVRDACRDAGWTAEVT